MTPKRALLLSQSGSLPQPVRNILENEGIVLEETRSPETALQQLRRGQYDVLFARSERLNQKHFHILQYLRENGVQTPIIISAQEANLEDARRALLEGAAGVMLPTESDEELIATVRKTLFHRTRNPEGNESQSAKVGEADLEDTLPPSVSIQIGTPLFESERMMIMNTLAAIGNNKSRAARLLGISRKTLHNKLAAYSVLHPNNEFPKK